MDLRPAPYFIDHPRSADDIALRLDALLNKSGFGISEKDQLRGALVRIAARYAEIVTQCVNAAPDLHLAAFADLLGGQARPAEPAMVHLSFKPAPGDPTVPVVVPAHTGVAAPPAKGGNEPVLFETVEQLELVRAEAVRALLVDNDHQRVAELSAMLTRAGRSGDPLAAAAPVTYALHIGQEFVFGAPALRQVKVHLSIEDCGTRDGSSELEWVIPTPSGCMPLVVDGDTTNGLMRSGEVALIPPPTWEETSVDGLRARWLTLRLRPGAAAGSRVRRWRPPRLEALTLSAIAETAPQLPIMACNDSMPLDTSKDFFPFGERPRFGATFQILSPTFGEPGARIEVRVQLTNPANAPVAPPIPAVRIDGRPRVAWEISVSSGFQAITADDGTGSLTKDGSLVFTVPQNVGTRTIAGKTGPWLRARLASGHYGDTEAPGGITAAVVRAPAIRSLSVQSTLHRGPIEAEHLVSQGALTSVRSLPSQPASIFPVPDIDGPALYIGLGAAPGAPKGKEVAGWRAAADALKDKVVNWHVRPAQASPVWIADVHAAGPAPVRWQIRSRDGWRDICVRDGTAGLTRSGIVALLLQGEPAIWQGSMVDPEGRLVWLRIVWDMGRTAANIPAIPTGLAINCVAAQQSQRLRNEVVGSSAGQPDQVFQALRTPIVGAVVLQVRGANENWMTWQEVADLAGSGPQSYHFMLNRTTGELRFGNGRAGRIPTPGANNIRLHEYWTGGGSRGNQPAGAVAQLRSAVPAVESVVNVEPAKGGLDAEDRVHVRDQASAWLRHRDRAVCTEDYVDLALRASPMVARAFCVAGRNLASCIDSSAHELPTDAGVVSVIVIPYSADPLPQPDLDLLTSVKRYLDARRPSVSRLVLVGPLYASVAVRMRAAARGGRDVHEVVAECELVIRQFLHPLTGGPKGQGWALGQRPHRSDFYNLISMVEGLDSAGGLSFASDATEIDVSIVSAGPIDVVPHGSA